MSINGYTYLYDYGKDGEHKDNIPTVKYQNKEKVKVYSRPFYPSDIIYSGLNGNDNKALKVFVVYSVAINDENTDAEELYYNVNNLVSNYDTERYILYTESDGTATTNNELEANIKSTGDFAKWEKTEDGKAKYKPEKYTDIDGYKENECKIGKEDVIEDSIGILKPGESTVKYIQFKVTDSAIQRILNSPEDGILESLPTSFRSEGKHYRKTKEGHIDGDKAEEHDRYYHISDGGEDNGIFIRFELNEQRNVSGTVFNDNNARCSFCGLLYFPYKTREQKEEETSGNAR